MKKNLIITLLIGLVSLFLFTGAYLETRQEVYLALRTGVTADDTALDGTTSGYTYQFADKPALAIPIESTWNICQVYFYGTDAENETCNYKIWAWREGGPATLVAGGVATLGSALQGTGSYYADTITNTASTWPTTVIIADSATNRCASLVFDALGYKYVYLEIDIPASSQVASFSAKIIGY